MEEHVVAARVVAVVEAHHVHARVAGRLEYPPWGRLRDKWRRVCEEPAEILAGVRWWQAEDRDLGGEEAVADGRGLRNAVGRSVVIVAAAEGVKLDGAIVRCDSDHVGAA